MNYNARQEKKWVNEWERNSEKVEGKSKQPGKLIGNKNS